MSWAFIPIAVLLTVTPGAATAMIVRSAMTGGWRAGVRTIAGNEVGVIVWALLSVAGISALIAASELAFFALKVIGAAVLIGLGIQSLRNSRRHRPTHAADQPDLALRRRHPLRDGVVTSLANPKLAVFFVALFPQFILPGAAVLPSALAMVAVIVALDLVWYSLLAYLVARARRAFAAGGWGRRIERLTGAVLIGLGIRLAFERR